MKPMNYLLSAVKQGELEAADVVRLRLQQGFWGLERKARYLPDFRPGDRCCFYAAGLGVVAHASVAKYPQPGIATSDRIFGAEDASRFRMEMADIAFLEHPIAITSDLRARLDAFRRRDPLGQWGWFVQTTSRVSDRDFGILTGTG